MNAEMYVPTEKVLLLNSHMYGEEPVFGEYVDWNIPDVFLVEEFEALVCMDIGSYALRNPHMIVAIYEPPNV
jgi:hypothetical protein